jgi:uncharacterized membrane protein
MLIDRRWLMAGIALSGLLNIFFVGFIVSHLYADSKRVPERSALVSEAQVSALPDGEKAKFVDAMAARQPAILAARKARMAIRHGLATTIAAPAFDRARVAAGYAALRRANAAAQEASQAATIDALAPLSQKAREILVAPDLSADGTVERH